MQTERMKVRKTLIWLLVVGAIGFILRGGIQLYDPAYWRPITMLDYSAVFLTTVNKVIFGLVLLLMIRTRQMGKGLLERVWGYTMVVGGIGSIVWGLGNMIEDAFKFLQIEFLTQMGVSLFLIGSLVSLLALILAFLGALVLPGLRYRWSWFYLLPILGTIILRDASGFIVGAGMLILAGIEIWDSTGEKI